MTDQQTLFDESFKPRPIRLGSPDARRLKVGKLNATQRSLNYLRKRGWEVDVGEKFVTYGGTNAQKAYVDELLEQRAELIRRLRTLSLGTFTATPADVMTEVAETKRFVAGLKEPKPPAGIGGVRKDLFGFMDIEAYRGDETLAVQTTSFQQMAPHLREFRRDEELRNRILKWIRGANRSLVIHGWRPMEVAKKRGDGTKAEWQVTERLVEAADLSEERF